MSETTNDNPNPNLKRRRAIIGGAVGLGLVLAAMRDGGGSSPEDIPTAQPAQPAVSTMYEFHPNMTPEEVAAACTDNPEDYEIVWEAVNNRNRFTDPENIDKEMVDVKKLAPEAGKIACVQQPNYTG